MKVLFNVEELLETKSPFWRPERPDDHFQFYS